MNHVHKEYTFSSGQLLQIVRGDITAETTDAIVNAANAYLEHGAGVAGAIVRGGGPQIQAESNQWVREHGLVSYAEPAYTHAGRLPCRYVIHAVGPVWGEGDEANKLSAAIRGSLKRAEQLNLGSIAFPAISTGIFGFPKPLAAQVCLSAIQSYLVDNPNSSLKLIRLVLFDRETLQTFVEEWEQDDHLGA
jgi:O-acetyl-ADP-ribose deacetylase (regulator of RNase III)